jgi:hypothetical protein
MRRLIHSVIPLCLPALHANAFDLDLTPEQFMAGTFSELMIDAAPGTEFRLQTDHLCHRDQDLLAYGAVPSAASGGFHWLATVLPERRLALEARDGASPAAGWLLLEELEHVLFWQHCDDAVLTRMAPDRAYFSISTVNGASSLSKLLEGTR